MLSDLMQRVRDVLKPYTFEDFVIDSDPKTIHELEQLEKTWSRYRNGTNFGPSY